MSYCRFNGENDAYIYATNDGFDCCGCSLAPVTQEQIDTFDAPFARFTTARQILDHIAEHRAAGDRIKQSADERIRAEYPDLDAYAGLSEEELEEQRATNQARRERMVAKMREANQSEQEPYQTSA